MIKGKQFKELMGVEFEEEMPASNRIILYMIAIFILVFILWASFATLDEVTRGEGRVIPSGEVQRIQSLEGGLIEEILVKEGEEVAAGQVLIRLRDVQASSDLGSRKKNFLGLKAQAQRLRAEAEGAVAPEFSADVMKSVPNSVQEEMESFRANQRNMNSQLQILEQQRSQRQQEISELNSRIRDLRGVLRISREEREIIRPLVDKGAASKVELLQLDRQMKEQQTELNSLQSSLPRLRSAVSEVEARIDEVKNAATAAAQTELAATMIEMNTMSETLSALEDRKVRTELRSPVDGTVKDITVNTVGGVIDPGEDLIEIVPKDDQLIIEARIRPSDIAFLHPNQSAVVKITAYDYAIYGGLEAKLIDISADSITDEQGETFYRVRLRTGRSNLVRNGEVLPIIPGMVASVDIVTGKKTVMEYILNPLIKTLATAMRER